MHPDTLGWAAAALMVATFSCREARRLRPLAVATNLAFIGYGLAAQLPPVLALHLMLLPINLWHWARLLGLHRRQFETVAGRAVQLLCTCALAVLPLMAGCRGANGAAGMRTGTQAATTTKAHRHAAALAAEVHATFPGPLPRRRGERVGSGGDQAARTSTAVSL